MRYSGERLVERRVRAHHVSGHALGHRYDVERYAWDAGGRLVWQATIDPSLTVHLERTAQHLVATFERHPSTEGRVRTFVAHTTEDGTGETPWAEIAPHGLWHAPAAPASSDERHALPATAIAATLEALLAVPAESDDGPWRRGIERDGEGRPTVVLRAGWPGSSVIDYDDEGRVTRIVAGHVRSRVELHYECDTWPKLATPPLPDGPWREEGEW